MFIRESGIECVLPRDLPSILPNAKQINLRRNLLQSPDAVEGIRSGVDSPEDFGDIWAIPLEWKEWLEETNVDINLSENLIQGYVYNEASDVNLENNPIWSCSDRIRPDPYAPENNAGIDCEPTNDENKLLYISEDISPFAGESMAEFQCRILDRCID